MDEKTKAGYLGDIEYFSAKLEADKNSLVFMPLASAYIKIGSYNDAVGVLLKGIDAHQELPSAKTMLAQAYLGLGQNEDAKGLLTEIRVIDPANYLAEKLLGDIYRGENDIKKALISYRNAFSASPEDGDLHKLIEELMSQSGIGEQELLDDRPMDVNEEEMLTNLGQELMDEVRGDLGDNPAEEVSEETVSKTVDEIVGAADSEPSLESFADEYLSSDTPDENELESLASVDDRVVPTDSLDAMKEAVKGEIHILPEEKAEEPEEEALPQADVSGMAAELSADLGLDGVVNPSAEEGETLEEPEQEEAAQCEDENSSDEATEEKTEEKTEEPVAEQEDEDNIHAPAVEDIDDIFSFDEAVGDELLADATEPLVAVDQEQPTEEFAGTGSGEVAVESAETVTDEAETEETATAEPDEVHPEEISLDDITAVDEESGEEIPREPQTEESEPENAVTEIVEPETADDAAAAEEPAVEEQREASSEETADEGINEEPAATEETPHIAEIADEIIPNNNFGVPVIEAQGYEKTDDEPQEAESLIDVSEPAEPDNELEIEESAASETEAADIVESETAGFEAEDSDNQAEQSEEVITDEAPEEVEITQEDEKAVEEVRVELDNDEKLSEELSILFAIDEMEDKTETHKSTSHVDYDSLDDETHEQVTKLENLLELIKTNAK